MTITARLLAVAVLVALAGCRRQAPAPGPTAPSPVLQPAPTGPTAPPAERADPECLAPIESGPATAVSVGTRSATRTGATLTFDGKDADGQLVLGLLGPINEDSGANLVAIRKYLAFFKARKADAIILDGDVGEVGPGITRVLQAVASSGLPVLVTPGNRECREDYAEGLAGVSGLTTVVDLRQVRVVRFPGLTILSLPGYHDANFLDCRSGCLYLASSVDELAATATAITTPKLLVSHGPPRGTAPGALDFIGGAADQRNVGDPQLNALLEKGGIAFGVFANIKEAGGQAVADAAGTTPVAENTPSPRLYVNPGPADSTTPWLMNDNRRAVGMAAVMVVKDGTASWEGLRLAPFTAQEKAEAARLEPPAR